MDGPSATVGLLYPGYGAEDDFPALQARLGQRLRLPLVHTSVGEDAHRIDALLDLGSAPRLAEGARALAPQNPDCLMWACTSGSFVFGWEGAKDQAAAVADLTGLPASSTSIAFVDAVRSLGLTRVALAASYPADVVDAFVEFLQHGGLEVASVQSHGIVTAAEVGLLRRDAVVQMVHDIDAHDADVVLVPDTAMHSLAWLDDLEQAAGRAVLTANQVTIWKGLDLLGPVPRLPGLGSLFEEGSS